MEVNVLLEQLSDVALVALYGVLSALIVAVGRSIQNWINTRIVQGEDELLAQIAMHAVHAVEQMFDDATGEDKLTAATAFVVDALAQYGITASPKRIRVAIESTVANMKGLTWPDHFTDPAEPDEEEGG
jgi:LL-H family phage holin